MATTRADIRMAEEFGEIDYSNYTCLRETTDGNGMGRAASADYGWGLATQRHIDVRTFNAATASRSEHWQVSGGALRPWQPTDVRGCELWLAADQITGKVDTNPISDWLDSSGLFNDAFNGTPANEPIYKTGIVNGKPVVRFDGVNDYLPVTTIANNRPSRTIFVVAKATGGGGGGRGEAWHLNGSFGRMGVGDDPTTWTYVQTQAAGLQTFGGTGSASSFSCMTIRYNNTSSADGFVNAGSATNFDPDNAYQDGGDTFSVSDPLHPWQGDIAEVIMFDSALSSTDLDTVRNYLGAKYNLGYGSTPPQVAGTTTFTTGPQATLNHWNGLITGNINGGDTAVLSSSADALDLTQLGTDALLTLALPNFPSGSVTLSQCFLDLSDDGFVTTASLSFSASANGPPTAGNTSVVWPISAVTGIDLTRVTDVRLRITAASSCVFSAAALRLTHPQWIPMDVDIDNWNGALRQCIPFDANPAEVTVANNKLLPTVWRAAPIPGVNDPRPIDATFAAVFNTGSQAARNSFALMLRGINGTDQTQLDVENQMVATLDGPLPGIATSVQVGRSVTDIEAFSMSSLDAQAMVNLDSVGTTVDQSWLQFQVDWGTTPSITVTRSTQSAADYQWTGGSLTFTNGSSTFANNTYYLAVFSLTDTVGRVRLYTLNQATLAITSLLFDTGLLPDSYRFLRRGGRVGWKATLRDGDASVRSIRPENLVFAEYKSRPLLSHTPVQGVRIYADSGAALQLWESWTANGPVKPTLSTDTRRTTSGTGSTRVDIVQPSISGQGVISNILTPSEDPVGGVTNWANASIDFDLWFPSAAVNAGAGLSLYLVSQDGNIVPLNVPRIIPDSWQPVRAFAPDTLQSGRYQLGITYVGNAAATFWIDRVSVAQRTVVWAARVNEDDPWVDLRDEVNQDAAGAVFTTRGSALQVRAQALRQDAVIFGPPKIVPVYATLGNLVWPEQAVSDPVGLSAPTPISVSGTVHNSPSTFTSGVTTSPAQGLINWFWAFGDGGSSSGPVVSHTYAFSGTYTVTLTVEDLFGQRTTYTTSVGIS